MMTDGAIIAESGKADKLLALVPGLEIHLQPRWLQSSVVAWHLPGHATLASGAEASPSSA